MSWQPHDPPKLPDEQNEAIAALGYNRFPHLFLELHRRFSAPADCLVVVLYLWDATVGQPQMVDGEHDSLRDPQGRIALSQIPVRRQQRDKWIDAMVASQLFNLLEKAPPESREGSLYEYNSSEATTLTWLRFFAMAGMAKDFKGDKDDTTRKPFASMFTPTALARWIDEDGIPTLAKPFLGRKK